MRPFELPADAEMAEEAALYRAREAELSATRNAEAAKRRRAKAMPGRPATDGPQPPENTEGPHGAGPFAAGAPPGTRRGPTCPARRA